MFDKLKQLGDLAKMRSQAQQIKKQLESVRLTVQHKNVTVEMTGDQKIQRLEVDGVERDDIRHAVNDAIGQVQQEAAKKMQGLMGM